MKKNVLILTGSLRTNGNSKVLVEAFIRRLEEKGHPVNKFRSKKKKYWVVQHV